MTNPSDDPSASRTHRWPDVRLSIRARLTLWYSLVVFAVLIVASVAVLWLQARLGLARVDRELAAAAITVAGVVRNEIDEGLSLEQSVRDMIGELDLATIGFAVLTDAGRLEAVKPAGAPRLPDVILESIDSTPATVAGGTARVRTQAVGVSYRGHTFSIVVWTSLAALQGERRTLQLAMLLGIPLALVFAVLGGMSIGRRSLQPLADMARQAESIGGRARDARLAAPSPHDELGTLARAFNGLLERLAHSLRAQRTFMADASHQLRTPVSVVRTAAQVMLSREGRTEAEYRESLDVVAKQAERLTKMVDDMFILALADADARPLQKAPLYLDEVIDEVVDEARLLAAKREITLGAESAGETPFVGDEHLLRQLLMNLIDNAIRHTPALGTIVVSLTRHAGSLTVAVTDSGSGIAPGDGGRIFDRFVRLDPPGSQAGAGLGLPIAQWIAEAHGGTLVLESTGPHGSRFLLTLPMEGTDASGGFSETPSTPTSGHRAPPATSDESRTLH